MPNHYEDIDNIRPVGQRYFPQPTADEARSIFSQSILVERALQDELALSKAREQLVKARQSETLGDLNIRSSRFQLGEARRKSAKEQDQAKRMTEVGAALSALLDSDLPDSEKRIQAGRIEFENSDLPDLQKKMSSFYKVVPAPDTLSYNDRVAMWNAYEKAKELGFLTDPATGQVLQRFTVSPADMKDRQKAMEKQLELAQEFATQVRGMKFGETVTKTDEKVEDRTKFADPAQREQAIKIVEFLAPLLGEKLPEGWKNTAESIMSWAGRLTQRNVNDLMGGGMFGQAQQNNRVQHLGIPAR